MNDIAPTLHDLNNDSSSTSQYDVAVIGAGSAGFSAAITASDEGAKVALIGHGTIGGTCVNVGCVPSKALVRAVETLHIGSTSKRFSGIEATARVLNWSEVVRQKQELVDDLRKAKYSNILPTHSSISYIEGEAAFSGDGKLQVDGRDLNARKIIIATGSRPALPNINGIEKIPYLTSTTALEMEELPKSLMILGAGYIGAELAQIFSRAGVDVTIISRRGLLPEGEPEISKALTTYFNEEGIRVIDGISYESIEEDTNGIRLSVRASSGPQIIDAEKLLLATGRAPNIDRLNLSGAGVLIGKNDGIVVDSKMRSSKEDIYAAGDVTGEDQFVYMAAYGAKIAAKNAMKGNFLNYDNRVMPSVVFTDPQIASVGHTNLSAIDAGFSVRTSVLSLDNVPRALAARDTRGLIKLIADSKTKKLLGAHILAPEGADSIQTAALAIKAEMTYEDLAETIFPYLTTVEGLKLAAQTFDMDVRMLSCCAG